jgi:glycosyltransferase involved in cell wall biosynthesis
MIANVCGQKPDISIIIRTKNEERLIGRTLAAIFEQDIDLLFEVIVVDSGSTDRTLDIVRRHAVRLYEIEARDFSYGRALNYGASLAQGRYLINLSAHCIPTNGRWIANILNDLRVDPQIAAVYGGQLPIKGMNPFEERSLTAVFTPDDNGKIGSPFSNANCAVRKEIWERYPFDEKASFAEDFIWSQMLPKEHKIKYVSDAAVYHSHPLQLRYWAKRSYDNGVLVQYLEHVYGLQYRWGVINNGLAPERAYWKGFFGIVGRHVSRCLKMLAFLRGNRYLRFLPVFPIYMVLEQYHYRRGLADGLKLYGPSKGPVP